MKKMISLMLALVLCLSLCACGGKNDDTGSAGLEYTENSDGTYTVTGVGSCVDEHVVIPRYYNRGLVTCIADEAFSDYRKMTSLTVPDSIKKIGEKAFWGCTKLETVYITDLEAWCNIYFEGLLSNPMSWGAALYLNGEAVTDLVIPANLSVVGDYTFAGCTSLTSVTIPDSVTEIGGAAFSECTGLTNVTIGSGVTEIGFYAFSDCTSLTSVTIPDSVTWIGDYAFARCSSLTSVIIPDGLTRINGYVFNGCSSMTSVTIPNSVTQIGHYAFYNCDSLTSIYFEGTMEQWEAVLCESNDWIGAAEGSRTVYCTDGEFGR